MGGRRHTKSQSSLTHRRMTVSTHLPCLFGFNHVHIVTLPTFHPPHPSRQHTALAASRHQNPAESHSPTRARAASDCTGSDAQRQSNMGEKASLARHRRRGPWASCHFTYFLAERNFEMAIEVMKAFSILFCSTSGDESTIRVSSYNGQPGERGLELTHTVRVSENYVQIEREFGMQRAGEFLEA